MDNIFLSRLRLALILRLKALVFTLADTGDTGVVTDVLWSLRGQGQW